MQINVNYVKITLTVPEKQSLMFPPDSGDCTINQISLKNVSTDLKIA